MQNRPATLAEKKAIWEMLNSKYDEVSQTGDFQIKLAKSREVVDPNTPDARLIVIQRGKLFKSLETQANFANLSKPIFTKAQLRVVLSEKIRHYIEQGVLSFEEAMQLNEHHFTLVATGVDTTRAECVAIMSVPVKMSSRLVNTYLRMFLKAGLIDKVELVRIATDPNLNSKFSANAARSELAKLGKLTVAKIKVTSSDNLRKIDKVADLIKSDYITVEKAQAYSEEMLDKLSAITPLVLSGKWSINSALSLAEEDLKLELEAQYKADQAKRYQMDDATPEISVQPIAAIPSAAPKKAAPKSAAAVTTEPASVVVRSTTVFLSPSADELLRAAIQKSSRVYLDGSPEDNNFAPIVVEPSALASVHRFFQAKDHGKRPAEEEADIAHHAKRTKRK